MYVELLIRPRFNETDANGHINNTVAPVWFEEGRGAFMLESLATRVSCMIANVSIDYLAEMVFGYPVTIRTGVSKIGNKSFTYRQEAWQRDRLCARASVVLAGFDRVAKITMPIPDAIREKLAQFMFEDVTG
jgi:acyl-CoA thioester hydrolase